MADILGHIHAGWAKLCKLTQPSDAKAFRSISAWASNAYVSPNDSPAQQSKLAADGLRLLADALHIAADRLEGRR